MVKKRWTEGRRRSLPDNRRASSRPPARACARRLQEATVTGRRCAWAQKIQALASAASWPAATAGRRRRLRITRWKAQEEQGTSARRDQGRGGQGAGDGGPGDREPRTAGEGRPQASRGQGGRRRSATPRKSSTPRRNNACAKHPATRPPTLASMAWVRRAPWFAAYFFIPGFNTTFVQPSLRASKFLYASGAISSGNSCETIHDGLTLSFSISRDRKRL